MLRLVFLVKYDILYSAINEVYMNPEKVLRAYFDGKEYYPFDSKWVWVKEDDTWIVAPCPDELMYTDEDGLLEIILNPSFSCKCEPKSLLDFGCLCGGN
jgi:hypothetical protein